jgi:type VI secretion system protein ImpJ
MRVTPRAAERVVWREGMHLAPHHFQAQRRHFEATLAATVDALFPFAWGLSGVELDAVALRDGALALVRARGLLPDGTPFDVPGGDPMPAPRPLAEAFAPDRDAHVAHLALAAWRPDAANVQDDGGPGRFAAVARPVVDETTGEEPLSLRFAAKRFRLLLDHEVGPDDVALPVARLRRDGAGRFAADPDFVPPCLRFGASARLVGLLRGVVDMLDAKAAALVAASPGSGAGGGAGGGAAGPAAYVGNELATRWLLHAVRSAEPPLRHLLATRAAHPERLWLELSRLAGALCTFALDARARDLPAYAHDDLTACFGALERAIRAQLDVVVAPRAVVVPLARTTEVLWVAGVPDPRCHAPGARWFLGVRTSLAAAETVARVPRLTKICSSRFVPELVRRAHPGLAATHVPAPPAALAPRPDLVYFEVVLDGPCARAVREASDLGVYVPDGLPDAALELAVLLPG